MDNLVSIIVPVYNAERYLDACITSIINQTYTNFELLLIDDGSSDTSGDICEKYCRLDDRCRVIFKVNGGVSSARNLGIEMANGEYLVFVDSDDYVSVTYIQNLMIDDSDFSISGIQLFEERNISIKPCKLKANNRNEISSFIKEITSKGFIFNGPYQKRFKISLLKRNNIKFNLNCDYGEDTLLVLEYLFHCNTAISIDSIDYFYRIGNVASLSYKISFQRRINNVYFLLDLFSKYREIVALENICYLIDRQLMSTLTSLVVDSTISYCGRLKMEKLHIGSIRKKYSWYMTKLSLRELPLFVIFRFSTILGDLLLVMFYQIRKLKNK